jgi:tRNA(His) 5'-end guanylyltransferase
MGKGKRLKGKIKSFGKGCLKEFSNRFTENFQQEIRNAELWDQMVEKFGQKRAEEILRECKAEVKHGPLSDETGDRTKDSW